MATRSKSRSQASRGKRANTRSRSTTRGRSGTAARRAGAASRTGSGGRAKPARRSSANGGQRKAELAAEICRQLTIHAAIEEEILYPAAAGAIEDSELVPEATVEHQSVKELIAKIERMDPDDELFGATVTVLGEYVRHHVKEEQNEMFPKLKRAGLDLASLGDQLRDRRAQIEMR